MRFILSWPTSIFRPRRRTDFDEPPYRWQATPIVDSQRWVGFDLFCAWQDVYLMSFMFFLSGLFVWPSLVRKRSWGFLRDRFLRIGLPLVLAVVVLMPIALYPVYRLTAVDPSPAAYWQHWRAPILARGATMVLVRAAGIQCYRCWAL